MAHLLGAEALHLEYPTRVIFDSVTLGVNEGDRVGIVGRNGDGKSTLLRLLSGRMEPDAGRVTRRGGVTIGFLDQSDELPDDEQVGHAIVDDRAEHEWAGDPRVRDVISGLVRDIPWTARMAELSGGQRRRVALAALLSHDWDVLFLDEPTNHLDIEGIAWLARHLRGRWAAGQGGLVTVTHDRWFLDEVATSMWEVHDRIVEPFEGGYSAYVLQRVERDRMAAASEAKRQNLMRKELAWLRRGAPARTSKPKFRIDAANQLIENEPPVRDPISLQAMAMQRLGKDVIDLENVSVSFAERDILRDITWRLAPGERTGILGVNGAGKSTLLGLLAGTVQPTTGRVKRGKTVRVAVLDQRLGELADILDDRVADVIGRERRSFVAAGKELTPGQLIERLGFTSAQLSTPVRDLSGGQKRRLQLLLVLLDEPNVLILDEPTNDMDTDMLAAIEDLLDTWPGTLIVVSHDRYLIERVTDQQYAILEGRMRHLPGGVEEYLRLERAKASAQHTGQAGQESSMDAPAGRVAASGGVSRPLSGADQRAAEKERSSIERRLERLAQQTATIHERMAAHEQSDYEGLAALAAEVASAETESADLETRWLELTEHLGD